MIKAACKHYVKDYIYLVKDKDTKDRYYTVCEDCAVVIRWFTEVKKVRVKDV